MKAFGFVILTAAFTLVGCNAKVVVTDQSKKLPDKIDGIPIRFADRQRIAVFQQQADGSYAKVYDGTYAVPDQSRMFVVGIDADPLCNQTLSLDLNTDGSPKTIGLKSNSQAQAALTQLGSSVASVTTSAASFDQQRQKAEQAALDQADALRQSALKGTANDAQLALALRQAIDAVLVQESNVLNNGPTMKPGELDQANITLGELKFKANQAARAAHVAIPYPGY